MKNALYWIVTTIIVAELLVGGISDLARAKWAAEIMVHLGYPVYMMFILGFWKVLASVALIVPRFDRIKEWAYAGTIFEMSGAVASHLFRGDTLSSVIAPSAFTLLTIFSWLLWNNRLGRRKIAPRASKRNVLTT
jgi:hypothetical protein